MRFKRGDIVLVPFPFSHLKAQKVRPALILSPHISDRGDIIAAFISSVVPLEPLPSDVVLEISDPDFNRTGLKVSSVFRMDKIVTLHESLVLRLLGQVTPPLQKKLDKSLKKALGLR